MAEKKHDLSATDNDIKNGNMILCAGLSSVYALRNRRKAAAKINAQRGTKASPLRSSYSHESDMFLSSRPLGHRKPVELLLAHRAESLPPHRRFVVTGLARMAKPLLGVS
jgi:hypothetical protein